MSVNGHGETPPPAARGPQIQHGLPPFDPGNQFLSIGDSSLTTSPQQTPIGQRLCVTVRTNSTTLTVFLAPDEIDQWVEVLRHGKGQMNGLILPG